MTVSTEQHEGNRFAHLPLSTSGAQETTLTGNALLRTPYFNKGSAFTEERDVFKLYGLSRPNDLAKNTFMTSLKEQNEVLYYRLILDHLKEMFSIIYTPTEGDAIADYSRLFRRPEGCFLNIDDLDHVEDDLDQCGEAEDIDLIVVSDGEQILGIGDQGVSAILISVAKLFIYTLCAGIHPSRTLPVVLDCGTNIATTQRRTLLGQRKARVQGEEYDSFFEKFLSACRKRYPKAYIHFEDFGLNNARRILDRYTPKITCFNDYVQGTGCVTLAAIMAAFKVSGTKWDEARFIMFGSGSAGTGIADHIKDAISQNTCKTREEAAVQIWCVDKSGPLLNGKKDQLTPAQLLYARDDKEWEGKEHGDLLSVVKEVKPHALIGTSTKPGAFSEDVVREMAENVELSVIFPLSNPTRLHEAKPQDLYDCTDGKVLVATGSPFPPVKHNGQEYDISECNNSVTFPGIGLGAVLSRTRLMTPAMLVTAVQALASEAPVLKGSGAGLLPDVEDVCDISVKIARNVMNKAVENNMAQEKKIPDNDKDLEEWIREKMWNAQYRPLKVVDKSIANPHARGEAGVAAWQREAKRTA
ncbi:hypothetical protein BDU57DRAFT_587599 [Ampelomyces quisqualis]|uniref:Malic enzyme n=1 Tax=Ampelomyces quisqualis TaxID=50730 RepID=A0A6A5QM28_AMPQU|nr:hypothetical protein BDU57DRAFT_587599 [Ampelomyces quisqualis]